MKARHALVICSYSRPMAVIQLLKQIDRMPSAANIKVYIIENSGNIDNISIVEDYFKEKNSFNDFEILQTKPGLATARNAALSVSNEELIHFLDDDVELTSDYFHEMGEIFQTNPLVLGTAPLVNIPVENFAKKAKSKITKIRGLEGKVTVTGRAYWISKGVGLAPVDWLPGCAMSFRRAELRDLHFSTSLEKGPLGGYALGEDLDFTFRVSKLGPLVGVKGVKIIHKLLPNQRNEWALLDEGLGRFLAYFEREFPTDTKPLITQLSLFLDTLYLGMRSLFDVIKGRKNKRNPFIRWISYQKELKHPILEA
jgi:GT2 family glycosyltransferase